MTRKDATLENLFDENHISRGEKANIMLSFFEEQMRSEILDKKTPSSSNVQTTSLKNDYTQVSLHSAQQHKSSYVDIDFIKQYLIENNMDTYEKEICEYILKLNIADIGTLVSLGKVVQDEYSKNISVSMRSLMSRDDNEIQSGINRIASLTCEIELIDFERFYRNPSKEWSIFYTPLKKKLEIIESQISTIYEQIRFRTPLILKNKITLFSDMKEKYHIINNKINFHIIIFSILKSWFESEQRDKNSSIETDEVFNGEKNHAIDIMDRKINDFKLLSSDMNSVFLQTETIAQTAISQLENIESNLISLISSWKTYCASINNLIISKKYDDVSSLAGTFIAMGKEISHITQSAFVKN